MMEEAEKEAKVPETVTEDGEGERMEAQEGGWALDISLPSSASDCSLVHNKHDVDFTVGWISL